MNIRIKEWIQITLEEELKSVLSKSRVGVSRENDKLSSELNVIM